jgi:uncharacterized membrane protein
MRGTVLSVRLPARLVLIGAAALLDVSVAGAEIRFQGLGHLPGATYTYSAALAVSADGSTVVGESRAPGGVWECEAFRWTAAEGMVGLGFLTASGIHSTASDVSADGSVVVGTSFSPAGQEEPFAGEEPFIWTAGTGPAPLLAAPGSPGRSIATAVSADGSVVLGMTETAPLPEVFRWTAGQGVDDPGLPRGDPAAMSADGSVVVGTDYATARAYHWTEATGAVDLGNLPGNDLNTFASDVSADGSVVVGSVMVPLPTDDYGQAFRWTEATGMVTLGPIQESDSHARAVSADGSIVVGSHSDEAFIWDANHGMRSLYDVLTGEYGLDLTGWRLQWANDISADGTVIVGYGTNPAGDAEAWRAEIPEPSALLLALSGIAGPAACLPFRRRRRRT